MKLAYKERRQNGYQEEKKRFKENIGGDWKAALCGLLDFYLLANLELHNMTFLTYWNLLSIIFMVFYFYFFSIYIILSGRYTHSISK